MAFKLTLHEAPKKRAICESKMRYEIHLNGKFAEDIYYNTRGYLGYIPQPNGIRLSLPESSISQYRKEIARINREAKTAGA